MELRTNGKIVAAVSSYEERNALKLAGFWWHGMTSCAQNGPCLACEAKLGKVWWTPKLEVAYKLRQYSSPAQKAEFDKLFGPISQALEASRATDAEVSIPAPPGMSYLGYQRAGIAYAMQRRNTLIADEMGLGKTVQALGVCNASGVRRVLCIARKSLRLNWRDEAQRWLTQPLSIVLPDSVDELEEALSSPDLFCIINSDKLRNKTWFDRVMNTKFDLLIVDEAQEFKNGEAQRTRAVLGWTEKLPKGADGKPQLPVFHPGVREVAQRCVFLTGTPIENRPVEIHTLAGALDPQFSGFSFLKRYCGAHQKVLFNGKSVWDFSGATHTEELGMRLRSTIMVRRLKKDVLTELPPKVRQLIPIAQTAEMRSVVDQLNRLAVEAGIITDPNSKYAEELANLDAGARASLTEISRLRHELGLLKVPAVLEHLQTVLETQHKVIVFAHHKDVVEQIASGLSEFGAVYVTGDTGETVRHELVKRFQSNPECRVFVGNIKAAGVGLTLTASSYVAMAELSWNPADVSQAEDRAHRFGQHDTVVVHHLVVDGSLDVKMARAIMHKQKVASRVLDSEAPQITVPTTTAKPKTVHLPAPEKLRFAVHEALKLLAGVCDGAHRQDEVGFNALDTDLGKKLVLQERLTDGQVWLAKKMLRKYVRQIPTTLYQSIQEDKP